jgi:hypothetical protein
MSPGHYKTVARSLDELVVRGKYYEILVSKIFLDAEILSGSEYSPDYPETLDHYILFEVVYSNLQNYAMPTNCGGARLIDSNGFQYAVKSELSVLSEPMIHKAKGLKKGTKLQNVSDKIHGQARSAGWLVFPKLKKSVVPHRIIFEEPGDAISGYDDYDILELVFDLSLYGRLIGSGEKIN